MAKQRILIADDDKQIVRILRGDLDDADFQILTAYDGDTAIHILRRAQNDLVLLDIMLPDRDGWEITRIIRSTPPMADIPIIMITARIDETDRVIGLELGTDDYIYIQTVYRVGYRFVSAQI